LKKIKFTYSKTGHNRKHWINEDDIKILLSRLPNELFSRLKHVHFNDRSWGVRMLGYVNMGHREIAICALPPRLSLSRYLLKGQMAEDFGAVKGAQWPSVAIRRFMLYETFLHELGHLQIVDKNRKSEKMRFAREKLSDEFSAFWRKKLWDKKFNHNDPVHNKPTTSELKRIQVLGSGLTKKAQIQKLLELDAISYPDDDEICKELSKIYLKNKELKKAEKVLLKAKNLNKEDGWITLYLGNLYYTKNELETALIKFNEALSLMEPIAINYICIGDVYRKKKDFLEAYKYYNKALKLDTDDSITIKRLKTIESKIKKVKSL
jgi:tetratricopeptide (TPR) repeat protein